MDGAVKAIRYLIEKSANPLLDIDKLKGSIESKKFFQPQEECEQLDEKLQQHLSKEELYYPSVIVVGHSLGSQVAYDAINKINLLVNEGKINTYNNDGTSKLGSGRSISEQLNGFITFGCPLDKIVFFVRENIPNTEYLRQQFLDDFHGFKQRDLNAKFNNYRTNKSFIKASCILKPLLKNVQWRNYYDNKDYISGGLDYYEGLTNIDCQFKASKFSFTHSYYWAYDKFYVDVIAHYLSSSSSSIDV